MLRKRACDCAGGVLALSAVLTVGNTAAFGATGGAIVVAVFWLVAAAALSLSVRRRPDDDLLLARRRGRAVGMCAFALVTTAPPHAFAYGAEHGWWALAAAAIAPAAVIVAAVCAPLAYRSAVVVRGADGALYGASVLVVTALTPHSDHVSHVAQLALSVVWAAAGRRAPRRRRRPRSAARPVLRRERRGRHGSRCRAHGRRHRRPSA